VNLWLALSVPEHVHSAPALRWWKETEDRIAFCRLTQLGLLRLLTTAAVMGGKPLVAAEAWSAYHRFHEDDRVFFAAEPAGVDRHFQQVTEGYLSSPKIWADAWLLAFARTAGGALVTFDRALAGSGAVCLSL
jgi:hypothetical protein